jgi:hypothetical protein
MTAEGTRLKSPVYATPLAKLAWELQLSLRYSTMLDSLIVFVWQRIHHGHCCQMLHWWANCPSIRLLSFQRSFENAQLLFVRLSWVAELRQLPEERHFKVLFP